MTQEPTAAPPEHHATPGIAWAALDTPDGDLIKVTGDRQEALRWRTHYRFFCPTGSAYGCGRPLELTAGQLIRPYFRHQRGPGEPCVLMDAPNRATATHHLDLQEALKAWLAEMGHTAHLEHRLSPGRSRRVDLHVYVENLSHVLEVQLSPISAALYQERDADYRSRCDHVTWLFDAWAGIDSLVHASLSRYDDVAYRIEVDPDRRGEAPAPRAIRIGVQAASSAEPAWCPLTECRLTQEGFWTPHLDKVKADAVPPPPPPRLPRTPPTPDTPTPPPEPRVYRPRPVEEPLFRPDVLWYVDPHARLDTWTASQPNYSPADTRPWARDCPADDRPLAEFIDWLLRSRIYGSGTVDMFQLPDVPDGAARRCLTAAETAGLLTLLHLDTGTRWQLVTS